MKNGANITEKYRWFTGNLEKISLNSVCEMIKLATSFIIRIDWVSCSEFSDDILVI